MDKLVFGIETGSSSKEKIQKEKRQRALAPTLEDIQMNGPDQLVREEVHRNTWFFVFWLGLGVLSTAGLCIGLPTFYLYLGPHIASVTMAAYQCNSLQFPSPSLPYPDDIICPAEPYGPLYRRAAYLHGYDPDDAEDLVEFEALNAEKDQMNLCMLDKCKLFVKRVAESIKFFEILALATYGNAFFELAAGR
ncbi:vacuole membrane protein 1-like [Drosophila miranda]|uniref:vacuole membrane protein 1-like n=1 Tax=Drosophila miranda TaxID=7229 RepID=UPI0007E707D6|nr:vacuole membrane protein 1-like [Drosophila miranda]